MPFPLPSDVTVEAEPAWARRAWLLPTALAPALLSVPFLLGQVLLFRDILHYTVPQLAFGAAAASHFKLPEWNPYLFGGFPFLADPGNRFLYPPCLVLELLFGATRAATAIVLVHLPLAGLGTHGLARSLGLGRVSASLAGVAYVTSGYLLSMHGSDYYFVSAAWLPAAAYLLLCAARSESHRAIAAAAGAVGLVVLNGDFQVAMLAGILCLGFALVQAAPLRSGLRVLCALALGGAVAAVQLIPTLLYASSTVRAHGLSYAEVAEWSLSPFRLIELLMALPFGVPFPENSEWVALLESSTNDHAWAISLYITPMITVAALARGWRGLTREWLVIGVAALLALLLALGDHLLVFRLWHAVVPLANRFRYPEKFLSLFTLALVLLGARALDQGTGTLQRPFTPRPFVAAAVGLGIMLLGILLDPHWLDATIARGLALTHADVDVAIARGNLASAAGQGLGACVAMGMVLILRTKRRSLGDLLMLGLALGTTVPIGLRTLSYGDASLLDRPPPIRALLSAAPEAGTTGRFFAPRGCRPRALPLEGATPFEQDRAYGWQAGALNYPQMWHEATVLGYSSAKPSAIADLQQRVPEFPADRPARLLGAAAIRSCEPSGTPTVTRLKHALPRVAVLPAIPTPANQILERYVSPDFDPTREVLVSPEDAPPSQPSGEASAQVTEDRPEHVEVETEGAGGLLVLADRYAAGWTATVDDRPARLVRANYLWRGVPVTPGQHRVDFRYRTPGLAAGAAVSLTALVLLVALTLRPFKKRLEVPSLPSFSPPPP